MGKVTYGRIFESHIIHFAEVTVRYEGFVRSMSIIFERQLFQHENNKHNVEHGHKIT